MTKVRSLTSLGVVIGVLVILGPKAHAQAAPDYPTGGTGVRTDQSSQSVQSVPSIQSVPDRTTTGMGFRSELVSYLRFRVSSVFRAELGPAAERKSGGTAWRASSRRRVLR